MSDRTVKLTREQARELKAVLLDALRSETRPDEITKLVADLEQLADVEPSS
ncbi:MAG: hypothetical protein WAN76_19725 [Candidatus Sulfotelmatobacter sp.]